MPRLIPKLSITTKLYLVVGIMGVLILLELLTLRYAMNKLSAVRAFVGGSRPGRKPKKTPFSACTDSASRETRPTTGNFSST